jgi:hypothetical protein
MKNKIDDFGHSELERRKKVQHDLHATLLQLKKSLNEKEYEDAIFHNIEGANMLASLVVDDLALPREHEMLLVLKDNIANILRLQSRHQ